MACDAFVDPNRVKQWSEQFEVFFHIPDHSDIEETAVSVKMPELKHESCWGIAEGSLSYTAGSLHFRMPTFHGAAADVGCVFKGKYPGEDAFQITYHGPRCYALSPPPPTAFAPCQGSGSFEVLAEWSGGMQGRITLLNSAWSTGREVRVVFGPDSLLEGTENIDRIYNAGFKAADKAHGYLAFELHTNGKRLCGDVDANGKG
eukprot:1422552-Prymnesium_polylepis.1